MTGSIELRPYRPDDAAALLALFRDSVRRVALRDYTPEQVRAWAPDSIDTAAWAARFTGRFAIVAWCDDRIAGFTDLEANGHIDRFFVAADAQRQGIGRRLMEALVRQARHSGLRRLTADVSLTARPFFASQEFVPVVEQTVYCRGVPLRNVRMEREWNG